ncbi:prepilin-type N-terminal cleavage/methylation domain-containing protein [Ottowia sp. GY511]|uniref:PilW family protein n=1 Tax=Ottowia flava TaxID=2675430 RepID=A0ABW4KXN9_9BURK|nr:PilW family protein [Ottowia sp. GY511]TXK31536.1 prepilin-type N-terminal cleavage/methylation domain-containing protein [Ottowia sp. GY511]
MRRRAQRGITLIELMVGIAIGLLVVAVAAGALMVSRGVSGTVSDASGIQQQAAYALRVIGAQLRQAGSVRLDLNPVTTSTATAAEKLLAPVAFETKTDTAKARPFDLGQPAALFSGTNNTLTVGFARDQQNVFVDSKAMTLARNCMGGPSDTSTETTFEHQLVSSVFQVDSSNQLTCAGNGLAAQAVIQNVANFRVRYLVQDATSTLGSPTIRYVDASAVGTNWGRVQGVEVCLVLYGHEAIDMPAGSKYTDCDGSTKVDMTTLTGTRAKRMHLVFRNVFQLRSQGLV